MTRLDTLKQMVATDPGNAFPRYGLAMELVKVNQLGDAIAEFEELVRRNPDYTAAYMHGGRTLERLGRTDDAKRFYRRGIEAAAKAGNLHAKEEIEAALEQLGA